MSRDFHIPASFGLCRLLMAGLMSFLAIMAVMPAGAQDLDPDSPPPERDYVSCGHFDSQASAQELLDSGTLDELGRQSLDGDGDGIACEDAFLDPNSPPPARDYVSCGHFHSQESAQKALDSGNLDETGRESLDGDGDGIACEVRWGEPASGTTPAPVGVAKLPNTGSGVTDGESNGAILLTGLMVASGVLLLVSRRLSTR